MSFHNERDSLRNLMEDAADKGGHTPHSVQYSAEAELKRRGFSERDIATMKRGIWNERD